MLKHVLLCSLSISALLFVHGQENAIRFKDEIFLYVTKEKNILYADSFPAGSKKKRYRLDFYQPTADTSLKRPVVIWMHGGGFKFGSKKAKSIRIWSNDFARRGYVCAAINYRLSKKNPLKHFNVLVQSCSDAMQDVTTAMDFLKQNATKYRIDTNLIVLAGNSAGAMVALQAAYSSNRELMALINRPDSILKNSFASRANITAVINFWGAMFNTAWLENATVPIVSVHGKKDRIVPYTRSESLYGSYTIHQTADSLRIPNRLKTYDRYGHELQKHFIPILRSGRTKRRWKEAGRFAAEFVFEQALR